ncbi:peroxidase 64 [Sesbania bispinosa]|nr:peroxidase 64 [Sesbania bispinosa]
MPIEDATWENELNFCCQFPHLSLGDKAVLSEAGSDRVLDPDVGLNSGRPRIWNVYFRKKKTSKGEN